MAVTGFSGTIVSPLNVSEENAQAVFELISDTHIDYKELVVQSFVKAGLRDIEKAECEINGVVVAGDITNYGDPQSLDAFYKIMDGFVPAEKRVVAVGNHDIGHAEERGLTNNEARNNFIKKLKDCNNEKTKNIYYSKVIDGYTFIVLGDESEDRWDAFEMEDKQLRFLDKELKKSSSSEKPTFVICHWPVYRTNGLQTVYEDGYMGFIDSMKIHNTMKKYDNVFFISGHAHAGINGELVNERYGVKYVDSKDGVTYVNLPSFGLPNRYGIPWPCTGLHAEIYEDKVVFRPRNYLIGLWYVRRNVTVPLTTD